MPPDTTDSGSGLDPTDPDVWQQYNDRPAWVRRHRTALMDATGKYIPRNLAAIAAWLDDHKAAMTKKLREQAEDSAADSTDTEPTDGGENDE